MTQAPNPYLAGNFAPVGEEVELDCPRVEGAIPTDLAGSFLRNGPNLQFEPLDASLYHPFDGDGMIHQLELGGGRASYRNRWIRTAGFERERAAGKSLWGGFQSIGVVEPPADMPVKNLANTALVWHANRLLATWEGGSPYELQLPELATVGPHTFDGAWEGPLTAHPKVDPRSGEMVVFCYSPLGSPAVRHGVVDASGALVHQTGVELPGAPVMIHDLAITPRHSLIMDMPLTFSLERAMNGGQAFDWEPSNGSRIGVLPRHGEGSEVRWFDIDPGYVFHTFNAWEEGDEIVLDACRCNQTTILADTGVPMSETQGRLHQYRLNLTSGKAVEAQLDPTPLEFARINEGYLGQRTRYGYATRFDQESDVGLRFTAVLKYDRDAERIDTLELGPGRYTQEFVFAPRIGSRAEDDGYLVGLVHDEGREQSECWILDARDFGGPPVARVEIPTRVPYGFHSHWVASA